MTLIAPSSPSTLAIAVIPYFKELQQLFQTVNLQTEGSKLIETFGLKEKPIHHVLQRVHVKQFRHGRKKQQQQQQKTATGNNSHDNKKRCSDKIL